MNNFNNKKKFIKFYFHNANKNDLEVLFSLPCCEKCYNKKDIAQLQFFYYSKNLKDKRAHKFITDIYTTCSFCGDIGKQTTYTQGFLNLEDTMIILKNILGNTYTKNILALKETYKQLSSNFVHFSTNTSPLRTKPIIFNSQNGNADLWGVNSLTFVLDQLKPLLKYYFTKLR